MAPTGLVESFVAAIQASLSVLLVIWYGIIAARFNLLDSASAKAVSRICVKMFLPALLLTQIGGELHAGSAHRYGIVLAWALVCHLASFALGVGAHLLLGMPDWITAAIMFNNTTSYPLLLIQALDQTGILAGLAAADESTAAAIERAKSYFLVFATVSSCLTFAVGPRLVDTEHAPEQREAKAGGLDEGGGDDDEAAAGGCVDGDAHEQTRMLPPRQHRASVASVSFFPSRRRKPSFPPSSPSAAAPPSAAPAVIYDRRPAPISRRRWLALSDRARWWLLFLYDFLNAPLLGAMLGAIIGLVPALHRAFFGAGGVFVAWLTPSLRNIGSLFVPLPVVVAGVSLYTSMRRVRGPEDGEENGGGDSARSGAATTPWRTTLFVLVARFVLWPLVSVGAIYWLATETAWLGSDPMLWFTLMLMPTGPPAMKLIAMVEVSDADEREEHKIAALLTVSSCFPSLCRFERVKSSA